MFIGLILGIVLGGAAVFFFIQNLAIVTVTALAWQITAPLAVILALCTLVGAAITLLLTVPLSIQADLLAFRLRARIAELEARLSPTPEESRVAPTYSSSTKTA